MGIPANIEMEPAVRCPLSGPRLIAYGACRTEACDAKAWLEFLDVSKERGQLYTQSLLAAGLAPFLHVRRNVYESASGRRT